MDEFTLEMKEKLETERASILEKLKGDEDRLKNENNGTNGDESDQASDVNDHDKLEIFNAMDQRRLKAIEAALQRIKDGKYGFCLQCGRKIPEGRLRAIPSAVLCVECKERQERM